MPHDMRHELSGDRNANAPLCLLIIDMINEFAFPDAEHMFPGILSVAEQIAQLKARMKAAGLPTIYVNDNFGQWRSDPASTR